MISSRKIILFAALALVACAFTGAQAGCPFDDGSCQEYCNQQGCNFGYCGHFAWIQCICRKCGDEWNWYDKVHYNPDKQVNQTELDSLKLNVSGPIILTNSQNEKKVTQEPLQQQVAPAVEQQKQPQQKPATLTTLLIPDLSDGSKLDLNDVPDENSEKFLDYLAKNHEKLAQATASRSLTSQPEGEDADDESSGQEAEPIAEETVEIQISSSNNQPQQAVATAYTKRQQPAEPAPTAPMDGDEEEGEERQQQRQSNAGAVTRLLKMAVAEQSSHDIF